MFNSLVVVLVSIVVFLSRNIASAYNESRCIGLTIYFYIILLLIGVTIYYTIQDLANISSVRFAIRSFAFLLGVYFTCLALFLVKHQDSKERNERDSAGKVAGHYYSQ